MPTPRILWSSATWQSSFPGWTILRSPASQSPQHPSGNSLPQKGLTSWGWGWICVYVHAGNIGPGGGETIWEKSYFLHVTLVSWWLLGPEPVNLGTSRLLFLF